MYLGNTYIPIYVYFLELPTPPCKTFVKLPGIYCIRKPFGSHASFVIQKDVYSRCSKLSNTTVDIEYENWLNGIDNIATQNSRLL